MIFIFLNNNPNCEEPSFKIKEREFRPSSTGHVTYTAVQTGLFEVR